MVRIAIRVRPGAARAGVVPSPSRKQVVHMAAILVPVAVAAVPISRIVGEDWMWPALSALEGAMIIVYALALRLRSARSA